MNILVNGISAKSGGGKSILTNFLTLLVDHKTENEYFVIVPSSVTDYQKYCSNNIHIIPVKSSLIDLYIFTFFTVNKINKKYNITLILNLADLIIPTSIKQVYLFDWPYAIYPDSIVWNKMNKKDWILRKFKLFLVKHYISKPSLVIAQTETAKYRLNKIYRINNIEIVPNAVSIDNLTGGEYRDFNFPENKIKLLYLTKYYTHKNIEVFLPLAKLIKEQNLPYIFIITIDEAQHKKAKKIIEAINNEKIEDVIINIGTVSMPHVPSLYQQTDALLMPTLLESFSGTYVEAMYHKKPIFTSDLDFARDVCQDAAFYFNPESIENILMTIKEYFNNLKAINTIVQKGEKRLSEFLPWREVFDKLMQIINHVK
ncbi:hypothetical protein AGMMS50239_29680 [Bacteroidia bacterium]|nr:hypothetical protein AGMMS50239_29680 [Bacteroidia bacterium]